MEIVIKFIIKNIKDNKFRSFLIVLSIVFSTALFFASSSISRTITKMYINKIRQYFGSTDIIIHAGENSPSYFFYINNAQKLSENFDYIIGSVEKQAYYKPKRNENNSVYLKGFDLSELQVMNPINILKNFELYPFTGKKIIIDVITAEKFNLKLNDVIDLEINNDKQRFRIAGIAEPSGLLKNDGKNIIGIVPIDSLRLLDDIRGKVTIIYLKLKNIKQKQKMKNELSGLYSRYVVREPFNDTELKQYTNQIAIPYMMMTIVILFMSVFIIYSSFKVITMERLPVIGTFRSIGATKKITDFVLFFESVTYGLIGGIIGCILGIGVLYIMSNIFAYNPWDNEKMKVVIDISFLQLLLSFIIALIVSFLSSLAPIIKVSKIPVKDLVLNKIENDQKIKSWKIHLGIIFLILSIIIPVIVPNNLSIFFDFICLVLSVVSVILLIPVITNLFVLFFQKIYIYVFGNEGVLASKNLRENKNILNNISLISIGISSLLMINTVSFSVVGELTNFYKGAKFDIWMWYYMADRDLLGRLKTVDGVYDAYGLYSAYDTQIEGSVKNKKSLDRLKVSKKRSSENMIKVIHGINKERFLDFWNLKIDRNKLEELDSDRNIMLTYFLKDKYNLKKGDFIDLRINKTNRSYKIIDFFSSSRDGGSYAITSERYFKLDFLNKYYDEIYIKTSKDPKEVENNISRKFGKNRPWLSTIKQMENNELKSYGQLFMILRGFSVLTLIIGIFGVLNNFIISFIQRKRHLAIYRSVGMSKKQIIKMIFIEALTGGLIGGIIGVMTGLLLIIIVGFVIKKGLNLHLTMQYSPMLFVYSLIAGIIITILASISPAVKSSRLNIIEAIKYE